MTVAHEQRNPHQGTPPRAWVTLRLATPDGDTREWKLIVDTGSPVSLIISQEDLQDFSFGAGMHVSTNFGFLEAAWFQLAMPELGLDCLMLGYASDNVVDAARMDHADFAGLAGLPLLRLLAYGGNGDGFWIRPRE